MKKGLLHIMFTLLLTATVLAVPAQPSAEPIFFSFRSNGNILVGDYRNNERALDRLRGLFDSHKSDIRSGRGHFLVVSYIYPGDTDNLNHLNNAAVQASVVRAYLKIWYAVPHEQVTFCFDNTQKRKNQVALFYVDAPMEASAWQNVFYTMKRKDPNYVRAAIANYNPLPLMNASLLSAADPNSPPLEIHDPQESVKDLLSCENRTDSLCDDLTIAADQSAPDTSDAAFVLPEQTTVQDAGHTPQSSARKEKKKFFPVFALKTNLLLFGGILPDFKFYDITPNLEAEFFFARRWSVTLDGAYSAWSLGNRNIEKRWGYMSAGLEPRLWFSASGRFVGFYAGLYGAYTQFSVKNKGEDGNTGDQYGGGISLGAVLPLTSRLCLELGARGGYHTAPYDAYYYQTEGFYYRSSGSKNGFTLQNVRVSLMYRFGSAYDKK